MINSDAQGTFYFIKVLHYILSLAFLINAIWIIIRSGIGYKMKKAFLKFDRYLSFGFITNLYLQLIFGVFLFSNLGSTNGYEYTSADGTLKMASKRLWPVEHFVLMLFALFIANLGLILALKTEKDPEKHRRILVYYSISIVLIIFSLSAVYLF